jgi:hypothetical protein
MKSLFVGLLVVCFMTTLTIASVAEVKPFVFGLSFNKGFVSGNTVTDQGGKGNNATLNNGAKVVPNGKYGDAVEFDGVDDYVEVEMDVPEKNFTMALWIKTDSPNAGVYSVLDGAAGAGGHDRHFYIKDGNICFRVWQGGGWCTTTKVSDGQWHHIALSVESGKGQTAYVDGKEVGTNAYDHSDFDWQKRVWIGFSNDAGQQYFKGLIDEVVYYSAPLSADELAGIMVAVEPAGKLTTTWSSIKANY